MLEGLNSNLAIIPARGGSKRLPGKNIRDFLGKPLLVWTIETAKQSGVFDRLILMTDDEEIAEIGEKYGAEVPFMEPEEFATDNCYIAEPLRYFINRLKEEQNYHRDFFVLLEPTSPGRQPEHIREVVEIFSKSDVDSILGVSEISAHFNPEKVLKIQPDGQITHASGRRIGEIPHRNQNVGKLYFLNSAIYAFRTANLFTGNGNLWGNKTLPYVMDIKYAMDIDTEDDWIIAEVKMKKLLEEAVNK